MNFAMCTCVSRENKNLYWWVEHHRKLGIKNYYFYDNDHTYSEQVSDWVKNNKSKFKDCHFKVYDFKAVLHSSRQLTAFDDYCKKHLKEYDWTFFLDVDEFLDLKGMTLNEWFKDVPYKINDKEVASILFRWKCFGFSGHIFRNDSKSPVQLYKDYVEYPVSSDKYPRNWHVKCCLKKTANVLRWSNPHCPGALPDNQEILMSDKNTIHNRKGGDCEIYGISPFEPDFDVEKYACVNHYYCKSFEEYIEKRRRSACSITVGDSKWLKKHNLNLFKEYNGIDDKTFEFILDEYESKKGKIEDM